jgi:alpha-tubulin suppressor-like RCC1 family protein
MKHVFTMMSLVLAFACQNLLTGCTQAYKLTSTPGPANLDYGQGSSATDTATVANENWSSVTTLDVGQQPVGSVSKSFVDVRNKGLTPAQITGMSVTAADGTIFTLDNRCSTVLMPGDRCRVYTTFTPDSLGSIPGTLNVVYNDGRSSINTAALPITASANNLAFLKFDTDTVSFNQNTIGYTLSVLFKVIYNGTQFSSSGYSILPAQGVTTSDPGNGVFQIDHGPATTCGAVISSNCYIQVNFSPTSLGLQSSSFNLSYFNGAEVLSTTGQVSGTGLTAVTLASLTAGSGNFGSVVSNAATPKGMAIPINFAGSVPATNIVITGPSSSAFTLSTSNNLTTCSSNSIAGSCQLYVTFNPTAYTTYSDSIKIAYSSNSQARPALTIALSGTGVTPAHFTPTPATALAFGNVPTHETSGKTFALKNDGGVAITTLSAITNSDSTDYTASFDASCATLAPGSSCNLTVYFKPSAASASNSNFGFSYFDGRVTQTIALTASGTGTAPLAMTGGATLDFGNVMIGGLSLPNALSGGMNYYGTTALTTAAQLVATPNSLSSPFVFPGTGSTFPGGGTCKAPLNPNTANSCSFLVGLSTNTGFPADVAVTKNFAVAYTGDAPGGGSGTLNFTAKMTPRNPPSLAFVTPLATFNTLSVNDSQTIQFTLKNSSAYYATTFSSIAIAGGNSAFTITNNGCSGGVVANGSCAISVKFNPTSVAAFSATLSYVYSNQISSQTVSTALSGTGSANITVKPNTTNIDFGTVYVGDTIPAQSIALTVLGSGAWTSSTNASAPYSVTPQACGASAANCSLSAGFTPTAAGTFNTTVTYTYSPGIANPSTITFNFKGIAINRTAALAFSSVSFPKTLIGQTSTQTITLTNSGSSPANAIGLALSGTTFFFATSGAPGSSGHCATSQTLAAGASCSVIISFVPGQTGPLSAALTASYTDAESGTATTSSATLSGNGTQMVQVFAGGYQSCMINEYGKVACWGRNTSGQLGTGDTNTVTATVQALGTINLGTGNTVLKLSLGDSHTCALLKNTSNAGFISCWGSNQSGRLGLGITDANSLSPVDSSGNVRVVSLGTGEVAVDVAAGFEHTCAALKSGKVKCWGGDTSGQLGIDSTLSIGTTAAQMGDGLAAVNLGGGLGVSVSAGAGHSCAVLKDGSTRCWGDNFYGQLGQGRTDAQIGSASGGMASLSAISLWPTLIGQSVYASSGAFTCVLATTGDIKCFGQTVANASSSTPFYGVFGSCWARAAYNSVAQPCSTNATWSPSSSLGYLASDMGTNLTSVNLNGIATKQFTVGTSFACALGSDASVRCFGFNQNGELGQGSTANIGGSPSDMGANLKTSLAGVSGVAAGYVHACAVLQNNTVKCWGGATLNATGLASIGVTGDSGVSGATLPSVLPAVYDGR